MSGWDRIRRRSPEILLGMLAALTFLGCLGSPDLWGKREQRAVAETLDTVDHDHWLVAQIQGRKRLEKPPLPRWTIAGLIAVTGRTDEWVFRLPGALSAIGMVGLTYWLGRRIAGRPAGLAAGLALTATGFFIGEMRQAGNDAPLAFFVTLAIAVAYRRIYRGEDGEKPADSPGEGPDRAPAPWFDRGWAYLFYGALGCGFLTKGPVAVLLVVLTIVPYLATIGRLKAGLKRLWSPAGLALFALVSLSWPVAVLIHDPRAAQVWYLEMAQKTASAGVKHIRTREYLPLSWPSMTAPWMVLGGLGVILPFLKRGRAYRPAIWLPWWWAVGSMAMFCFWKVAKPNYYLPCMPGAALLVGDRVGPPGQPGEGPGRPGLFARMALQSHWVGFFLLGVLGPAVIWHIRPHYAAWSAGMGALIVVGVIAGAWWWRRGADAMALAPIVAAVAIAVPLTYGMLAPRENPMRSHRELASAIDRILPDDAGPIFFFADLDEGLWFYLRDHPLVPVPNSQAEYNRGLELYEKFQSGTIKWDEAERLKDDKEVLLAWLRSPDRQDKYLMIRAKIYDRIAGDLEGIVTPLYRERDLTRNELILFQVESPEVVATIAPTPRLR
ncbi:MAG: glycosyltransferase family 39 protein [Isosphaeraceae bacterium]